jgi:hypothetical protein
MFLKYNLVCLEYWKNGIMKMTENLVIVKPQYSIFPIFQLIIFKTYLRFIFKKAYKTLSSEFNIERFL